MKLLTKLVVASLMGTGLLMLDQEPVPVSGTASQRQHNQRGQPYETAAAHAAAKPPMTSVSFDPGQQVAAFLADSRIPLQKRVETVIEHRYWNHALAAISAALWAESIDSETAIRLAMLAGKVEGVSLVALQGLVQDLAIRLSEEDPSLDNTNASVSATRVMLTGLVDAGNYHIAAELSIAALNQFPTEQGLAADAISSLAMAGNWVEARQRLSTAVLPEAELGELNAFIQNQFTAHCERAGWVDCMNAGTNGNSSHVKS